MTWACAVCTFENVNDTFLACAACGSERSTTIPEWDAFPSTRPGSPDAGVEYGVPVPKPTRAAPRLAPPQSPIRDKSKSPPVGGSDATNSPSKTPGDALKPIYQELVETERIYVKELHAIESVFLMPLKAKAQESSSGYATEGEVSAIFGNLAELSRVNQELLNEFVDALSATPEADSEQRVEAICRCFLKYVSHLKMYAVYAIRYDEAQTKLKKIEAERYQFREFINAAGGMNDVTMNQPLSSFLIKPIQRICKYPLFFHQMIKSLPEASPILPIIKRTLDAASEVASKINADKLRAEQQLRAFEVAKRIEQLADVVLEPGRKFVGEWKCLVSEGNSSLSMKRRSMANKIITTEKKPRTCFLFNDVLLVTKEVGTGVKLRYELRLWMSLDQVQFGGISEMSTKSRESSSNVPDPIATNSAAMASGDDKNDRAFRAKLFQLPLEIVHVASTDREKCQTYRERQQQAQTSQIGQIASRRPSFLKKKSRDGSSNNTDTVITSYTMWFRSGAERARVSAMIEKTIGEYSKRNSTREEALQKAASFGEFSSSLPPMSPTRNGNDSTKSSAEQTGTRNHVASSEDSIGGSGARRNLGDSAAYMVGKGVRRADSLDSGLDRAESDQPFHAAVPAARGPTTTFFNNYVDPIASLPVSTASSPVTSQSEPPPPISAAHMRRRSSARPRPPPPPLPTSLSASSGLGRTPSPSSFASPGVSYSTKPVMPRQPQAIVGSGVVGLGASEDLLVSKWFGD